MRRADAAYALTREQQFSAWNEVVAAILNAWDTGNVKKSLRQSMHIYLKNVPAKFHPDPIWNDGALGCFWRGCVDKKINNKTKNNNNKSITALTTNSMINNWLAIGYEISSWSNELSIPQP